MIISPETYQAIVATVQRLLKQGLDVSFEDCDQLGVSRDAVWSIYQQQYVKRQKRLTHVVEAQLGGIIKVGAHCDDMEIALLYKIINFCLRM